MKKQKIIITLLMIATALLILMPKSNAALQSNGSAGTTQTIDNWLPNIRKMEALNGGMGLTETIGGNLVPTTASNNLDVHMEKNTEYGAMAILSASSYGNPNKIASGGTTTGNKTGIVINLNSELVAAGDNGYGIYSRGLAANSASYRDANPKYKNVYNQSETYGPTKIGDAIVETSDWHGGNAKWFYGNYHCILRANSGSIFSYYGWANGTRDAAYFSNQHYSRAAMVCGEGI